jgi:hypothetical protein
MAKIRADHIKRALSKKHSDDFFTTECKNGPSHSAGKGQLLILDALAIKKSWANPCITGYEIKVDRQDFMRDEKWPGYKEYCHRFSFVCPKGMIEPEELPEDIGLIYYNVEKESLYTKRKAAYRDIEISADMLYYILMSKVDSDRHPFFSTQREKFEAYIQDKVSRDSLSYSVKSKLLDELKEMEKQLREANRFKKDAQKFKLILPILRGAGIDTWWSEKMLEDLRAALSGSFSPQAARIVNNLKNEIGRLAEQMERSG